MIGDVTNKEVKTIRGAKVKLLVVFDVYMQMGGPILMTLLSDNTGEYGTFSVQELS